MTRARLNKPVGENFAEPAESAGNEITALGFDLEFRSGWLTAPRHKCFGERNDHLSDMLAAGHEPKRRIDTVGRERAEGERTQGALFDQLGNLREHVAGK